MGHSSWLSLGATWVAVSQAGILSEQQRALGDSDTAGASCFALVL